MTPAPVPPVPVPAPDSVPVSVPHNGPLVTEDDIAAVTEALRSGWLATGPRTAALEAAFAERFHPLHASAVSSGTAGLTLALRGAGLGDNGATVAVPTYGCSALLDAVLAAGCTPLVVDVTERTLGIDPGRLDPAHPIDAVIAVHTHGHPADLDALRPKTALLVEDCCQSLGGRDERGRPLGAIGDASVFSFYATKVIAAGEGGMLLQRDPAARDHVRGYQDPGAREVYAPRFNHRLSDPAAALALSQFRRLDEIAAHRRAVAARYTAALPPHVAPPPGLAPGQVPYRYCLRAAGRAQQQRWIGHLRAAGIAADPLIPARHLLHRQLGLEPREYPVAERVVDSTVSVPLFAALTEEQADRVAEALTGLPD
ncbi:DegT/DnrJ/EryC1/StrS family aminotransferase [Streptomyces goshikiensis]|uniref:DegT/DnrJ/EryC1/StrS family aminotransferase n=1 Tax=Streptomyces goshikiensis TaxID=1942 RepID=UPI001674E208|nr:DegT/DnrJ/EryC1/StrS family aminotransferase [Streptomyces goshikiensis]GHD74739.1 perosamine synthetase [Streptomyces goshikiensis]